MDEYGNIIDDSQASEVFGDSVHEIEGFVEHIIYRNEDNGYTVFNTMFKDREVTCIGTFSYLNEGEYIVAQGSYVKHPVYWKQFKITSYALKTPEDEKAVLKYLGSGAIRGIGEKTAQNIVNYFGADTFRIIEEEPERLAEIKGISMKKAMDIADQLIGRKDMRNAMMFLQKYGISMNMSSKIYEKYGEGIYAIIQENPYRLADDIGGIGFKMADDIAQRVGIRSDSDYRIRSGILYVLLNATAAGHTFLPMEDLVEAAKALLLVDIDDISHYVTDLALEKKVVIKNNNIYASSYYYMELKAAAKLVQLDIEYGIDDAAVKQALESIEKSEGITLDDMQREAVIGAIRNGLMIITGGPGTGKTTIINTIIRYFGMEGMDIRLAAPTGRAAKRMSETTGYEAQTVHRLLEVNGGMDDEHSGAGSHFERNEMNPLETDVIIVDEMSMVDINLINALLAAVVDGTRLILVGDVDQLPSVGPGNVLRDMINSECFNVVKLTRIFRQSDESEIITNAHAINRGEDVALNKYSRDFLFIHRDTSEAIIAALCTVVRDKLPRYVDADVSEIQVMTPMRKGVVGVEKLNQTLQTYLNPPEASKLEKEFGQVTFRVGDKVMQIRNNYQIEWERRSRYGIVNETGMGVFNGDTGIIEEIRPYTEEVVVRFDDDRYVKYGYKQLEELELAYAITVHKSQGSEYPAVIIPMFPGPRMLMTRNLLYTAVTRARKCVCLIGREDCFREMIANGNEQKRYSSLDVRIKEVRGD